MALLVATALATLPLHAQQTTSGDSATAACPSTPVAKEPSADERRAARDLVSRAQEAAIVSNDATARDLYQRAARLDPTDPAIAYALARSYESAHDARAIAEYCRFLALQPAAPEAPDVRRRIAALSFELTPRDVTTATPRPPVVSVPSPSAAFAYGLLFPGGGQYYTRRPALGLLVTAATAGALFYGLEQQTVTQMQTAIDPNGQPYTYPVSHTTRPNVAPGIGAAAAISLLAAIEASTHARAARRLATVARSTLVAPTARGIAVGARIALCP